MVILTLAQLTTCDAGWNNIIRVSLNPPNPARLLSYAITKLTSQNLRPGIENLALKRTGALWHSCVKG